MCRTPQEIVYCVGSFPSGRGFFHDYLIIVLCTCHFVTMDEAFSCEKLFLKFGRKVALWGGRGKPEKVLGHNLFMGGLNLPLLWRSESILSSAATQLQQNTSPLVSSFIVAPVFSSPPGQLSCPGLLMGAPQANSWAWESPGGKLFVCSGKMPTSKSPSNLPLCDPLKSGSRQVNPAG